MALNLRSLGNIVRSSIRLLDAVRGTQPAPRTRGPAATRIPAPRGGNSRGSAAYAGDFAGTSTVRYAPSANGRPEPGEIVWAWVPYEEDHSQGKDRPVLLVGTHGRFLLGLMLTSKDHDQDHRADDNYVDLGSGAWDRQARPSEARLDRVLQLNPKDVRREGAILDPARFELVASSLRRRHGWG
jgi:hypothetical protein